MVNISLTLTIIHSILYVINLSAYLILIKYLQNTYAYDNFWFNTLLSILLSPIYLLSVCIKSVKTRIRNYGTSSLFAFLVGFIYTFESILLYYSVNSLNLSYYTILRSSFIIWNIPFYIYLFKKTPTKLYYLGVIFLLLSYTLIIYYYLNSNIKLLLPTIAIMVSCLLNAVYNIMIEYSIKKYNIYNLDFHIIFQVSYLIFAMIPSMKMTIENPPPITGEVIVLSLFISVCLQLYFYNKIIILQNNSNSVPSNVLMSGLDLIRRLVLLLFSFLMYKDDFNIYVGVSVLFFLISGVFIFLEYLLPFRKKEIVYCEMIEVSV